MDWGGHPSGVSSVDYYLLHLQPGAAPAQKKWGEKEIELMARRYT